MFFISQYEKYEKRDCQYEWYEANHSLHRVIVPKSGDASEQREEQQGHKADRGACAVDFGGKRDFGFGFVYAE